MNSIGNWHRSVREVQQPSLKERLFGWQQQTKAAQVDFTTGRPTDKSKQGGSHRNCRLLLNTTEDGRSPEKPQKAKENPRKTRTERQNRGKWGEHRVMSCNAGNTLGML
jgi:hypothetical protein